MTGGGTARWTTDEKELSAVDVVEQYLTPNGFKGRVVCVKDDTVYFKIDYAAMDMANFYTWTEFLVRGEEVPRELDVWRPFFWIGEAAVSCVDEFCWGDEVASGPKYIDDFWAVVAES